MYIILIATHYSYHHILLGYNPKDWSQTQNIPVSYELFFKTYASLEFYYMYIHTCITNYLNCLSVTLLDFPYSPPKLLC